MGKKAKSKKRRIRSSTSLARRQRLLKKILPNKIKNPSSDLTFFEKILRYKKWFPFGVVSFLITVYISNWPKNLDLSTESLGKSDFVSNVIILYNPNSYDVSDVVIEIENYFDAATINPTIEITNSNLGTNHFLKTIGSKKSKHVIPKFFSGATLYKISKCKIDVIYSLKTPFIYPDIKNEIFSFSGYLKKNGEVIYIYN